MSNLADLNFDASTVQTSSIIPAGVYEAIVIDSDRQLTKDGNGQFLKLQIQIVSGDQKGRQLTERLNLWNANETAVNIAKAQLAKLCKAIGKTTIADSAELHNIPFAMEVTVQKRKDNGEDENRIKGYSPIKAASKQPAATSTPW